MKCSIEKPVLHQIFSSIGRCAQRLEVEQHNCHIYRWSSSYRVKQIQSEFATPPMPIGIVFQTREIDVCEDRLMYQDRLHHTVLQASNDI